MSTARGFLAAPLLLTVGALAHPPYVLVDVGDFAGNTQSGGAVALSGRGATVGGTDDAVGRQAYVFSDGTLMRLPTPGPPSAYLSEAFAISDSGVVAGNIYDDHLNSRASLWDAAGYHDLGTLGPPHTQSGVLGINNLGAVVGYSAGPSSNDSFLWLPRPAYGYPAGMSRLVGFGATSINNFGQLAAVLPNPGFPAQRPAIWLPEPAYGLPAGLTELNAAALFPFGVLPHAINDRGAITGRGQATEVAEHPALWLPSPLYGLPASWNDLGLIPPDDISFAWDINDRGWIVGTRIYRGPPPSKFEDPPTFIEGWLWIPGRGRMILNDLLPPGTDYFIFYPRGINNRGQIAASAASVRHGDYRGVLLTPLCVADWDGSGSLGSGDFFVFLSDFFDGFADFTGDGTTTSADFFEFLADFFAGCP